MANENEAESFALEPGSDETLTGTWTWNAAQDGVSKVIVKSPTETTELTGGSIIFTNIQDQGEDGRIQITNDDNDLFIRAKNKIYFNDSTQANPISLEDIGDVVGSDRPGGNVCGGASSEYLKRSVDEQITGSYKWKADEDGVSKVTVESPTETTQLTGGSIIFTNIEDGESGRIQITNTTNDLILRSENRLLFGDEQSDGPVSLAELIACCDSGSDGGGSGGYAPIVRNFTIDIAASGNPDAVDFGVDENGQEGTIIFGKNWDSIQRANGAFYTDTKTVTMPAGANGAIVFLQNSVELSAWNDPNLQATGSQRALHCSQRCEVSGATLPINPNNNDKTGFGQEVKSIVRIPGNTPDIVEAYVNSKSFDKFDLINFSEQAQVSFRLRMDILKGGRGVFRARAGRIVILPFYSDNPSQYIAEFSGTGFVNSSEQDLQDYYDKISPKETPQQSAMIAGAEYRDLLRRILVSLESRKQYPPAVDGATEAEYDARIEEAWALVDNSTLQTIDEFEAALQVYYTEVTKEKYGINFLFTFELEAAGADPDIRQLF